MHRVLIENEPNLNCSNDASDSRDKGIAQVYFFTYFNAFLRGEFEQYLNDLNLGSMERPVRLFWRALTFKAQGGSDWKDTDKFSLNSLKTLMPYLGMNRGEIKSLWLPNVRQRIVESISDIQTLQNIARNPELSPNLHPIAGWRRLAIAMMTRKLNAGVNYNVAMKQAAVAEALLQWQDHGFKAMVDFGDGPVWTRGPDIGG